MDKLRQWIALTVVLILVIIIGSWFLLISPKRSSAAGFRQQTATVVSSNAGLQSQIALLKSQQKSLPEKQATLAAVAARIPDNPALPTLIRDLTTAADQADVELLSLSPSQPAAIAAPASTTVSAAGASAAAASSVGTLEAISVSLSVVGGYFQVEQFLDRLESLGRAMKVTAVSLAPGSNPVARPGSISAPDKVLAASISGTVFMATGRVVAAVPGK